MGGRRRHVDMPNYFLHKLKDQGRLVVSPVANEKNDADIFTTNVTSAVFNRHEPLYIGVDQLIIMHYQDSSREDFSNQNLLKLGTGEENRVLGPARPKQDLIPRQSKQHP